MKRKNKKKGKINTLKKVESRNFNLMLLVTFFLGVLLIFSAYAWFYASLDVQVKFVNLVVCKKYTENEFGKFLCFDDLTLVPYDIEAIDKINKLTCMTFLKRPFYIHDV